MATTFDTGETAPRIGAGWGWMLASGIVSIIVGLAAAIWPFSATLAATLIVGIFFIAAGVVALIAGFAGRGHGRKGYLIGYGLLSLVLGILMAVWPVSGAMTLTLFVAAWLAVRGIMEIIVGTRLTEHKGMMIVLGIINLVLAVAIFTMPFAALTLPGYILAFAFLMGGFSEARLALHHRTGAPAFG